MERDKLPSFNVIIRLTKVKRTCGLSRATIYRQMKKGLFPSSVALGENSVGWFESDVKAWLASRKAIYGIDKESTDISKCIKNSKCARTGPAISKIGVK